jgi:spore coat polysaccharide biosynthesis protein SpsF
LHTGETVLILQARHGSTRLPGKVLLDVLPGRTMLALTLERLRHAELVDEIVVAVPEGPADDAVASEAVGSGAQVFRGPESDVLARYLGAAVAFGADTIVRVTSDCPLIDPDVVNEHVRRMDDLWDRVDFVTNMLHQSYPLGLAVEVMPMDTLERMARLSTTAYLREHVTTLAYEEPSLFRIENILDDEDRSHLRWTVDYPEDLELVRAVYQDLYIPGRAFRKAEILELMGRRPSIATLNAGVG